MLVVDSGFHFLRRTGTNSCVIDSSAKSAGSLTRAIDRLFIVNALSPHPLTEKCINADEDRRDHAANRMLTGILRKEGERWKDLLVRLNEAVIPEGFRRWLSNQ